MKLNRRSFVASLTGAVASRKTVVKEIEGIQDTFLPNVKTGGDFPPSPMGVDPAWVRKQIKEWAMPEFLRERRKEFSIQELDPDTYALRSIALGAKIRISKEKQFERFRRSQMWFFERILSGE